MADKHCSLDEPLSHPLGRGVNQEKLMTLHRLAAKALSRILAAVALAASAGIADAQSICRNSTGEQGGYFWTFWRDTGSGCMTLGAKGQYSVDWNLGARGNMVVGKGWRTGSATRTVGYNASVFEPGVNGYLTLYGWSTNPLVEYYVVDSWGSNFTPPGPKAEDMGSVTSDGGTYRIFRTQRVNQPSIRGTQTFYQYWSVRTERRPLAVNSTITFPNHVAAWSKAGMKLGTMNYQVMASEGFGSTGRSSLTVWQQ
jgi:endo-1,4-beta-xylanase